ncbi:uncharacterized protein EI90DRAFT_3041802 [Cantharellus anzutake]|uniref:uncharacterized protein n=1 Tax=Cantharellus anzutake TaxID=1750568 RepID=UPI0019070F6D|nr:uncharacterized protein EI90DRAFT_3041802 [Cantharellus anzutake]KAF8338140.1 hypothetical protein EI90DRAFT_3041802 [Cantharellus anzutake]
MTSSVTWTLRAALSRPFPLYRGFPLTSPSSPSALSHHVTSRAASSLHSSSSKTTTTSPVLPNPPPKVVHTPSQSSGTQHAAPEPPKPPRPQRQMSRIRSTKAALSLTPSAVQRVRALISGPTPQLIRIGVRNKGCAGMQYNLEYVEQPGKFDEVVQQDDVKVLIDSKALFSIIGSEMDWQEDRMSSKFVFKNPNIIDACGCGESFNVSASSLSKPS